MKNLEKMTEDEKHGYIFEDTSFEGRPRSKWITDCLLGDIRTFLDGIQNHVDNKDKSSRGGGNLSIPILVNTALEFVARLYVGATGFKQSEGYDARKNIKRFIENFFPGLSRQIPLLLWDGTRNGLVHTFYPKPFEYKGYYIRFQFVAEDRGTPSDVKIDRAASTQVSGEVSTQTFTSNRKRDILSSSEQSNKTVLIKINVFELYKILEKAIKDYRAKLKNDENLQDNFILAWRSIENYKQPISDDKKSKDPKSEEAERLLSALKNNSHILLFSDDFCS